MMSQVLAPPQLTDLILNVSLEDYLAEYASQGYEWSQGVVSRMPISAVHDELSIYIRQLLNVYFALHPLGVVRNAPFLMRLDAIHVHREPDLQLILGENQANLTNTAMFGAADIAIEIVSQESQKRDYEDKFREYQAGGVAEYWLIDPLISAARFYQLTDGHYQLVQPTADDLYQTPRLPQFKFPVGTLWQTPLPNILEAVALMQKLLG